MSTVAEQIAAVREVVTRYGLADHDAPDHLYAALRDVLATLEGMAAPGTNRRGPHDYDGLVCKNCGERYGHLISTWCQNYPGATPSNSPSPQQPTQEAARELLHDLEGYVEYCGDRFSQRVRSREDAQRIITTAFDCFAAQRVTAATDKARREAMRECAKLARGVGPPIHRRP